MLRRNRPPPTGLFPACVGSFLRIEHHSVPSTRTPAGDVVCRAPYRALRVGRTSRPSTGSLPAPPDGPQATWQWTTSGGVPTASWHCPRPVAGGCGRARRAALARRRNRNATKPCCPAAGWPQQERSAHWQEPPLPGNISLISCQISVLQLMAPVVRPGANVRFMSAFWRVFPHTPSRQTRPSPSGRRPCDCPQPVPICAGPHIAVGRRSVPTAACRTRTRRPNASRPARRGRGPCPPTPDSTARRPVVKTEVCKLFGSGVHPGAGACDRRQRRRTG
jgi:hypothetical protein